MAVKKDFFAPAMGWEEAAAAEVFMRLTARLLQMIGGLFPVHALLMAKLLGWGGR